MNEPRDTAKTTPPRGGEIVLRRRLHRSLAQRDAALCFVTAPPGGGKTVLGSSFADALGREAIWYQVDARDADPAVFFACVGAALERRRPRAGALPRWTEDDGSSPAAFARRWFEAVAARGPLTLVLDDFHDAGGEALGAIVREALLARPPGVSMVVLSRCLPPNLLARFFESGAAEALPYDELRFTLAETRALARLRGVALSAEEVADLHARSEGWAAGASLLLRDEDPSAYLEGEVLRGLSGAQRATLAAAAHLPTITEALVVELSGAPDAGRVLAELAGARFLCEPVREADPPAFRLHGLLAAFLRRSAARREGADGHSLRERAREMLVRTGRAADAARLCVELGDARGLASVVEEAAPTLLAEGKLALLGEWLGLVGDERIAARPWLSLWAGHAALYTAPEAARVHFERAEKLFEAAGDLAGTWRAWCGRVDAVIFAWRDLTELDDCSRVAADRVAAGRAWTSAVDADVTVRIAAAHAFRLRAEIADATAEWCRRAREAALRSSDAMLRRFALQVTGFHDWANHRFAELEENAKLLCGGDDIDVDPVGYSFRESACAARLMLEGDPRAAATRAQAARAKTEARGVRVFHTHLATVEAQARLAFGDVAGARSAVDDVRANLQPHERWSESALAWTSAWCALVADHPAAAVRDAERSCALMREAGGSPYSVAGPVHVLALARLALGDALGARAAIDEAAELRRAGGSIAIDHFGAFAEAWVLSALGERAEADARLASGLAIGRRLDVALPIFWPIARYADLCARALDAGIEVPYVRDVVRRLRLRPSAPPVLVSAWPFRVRVHALGRFELFVDGALVRPGRKALRRPLDLLYALIAHEGRALACSRICDELWPDAEGDAARGTLATTLHRLRALIGGDAVVQENGRLQLDPYVVWVDSFAFARAAATGASEVAAALYEGPLLPDEDAPFVLAARESLAARRAALPQARTSAGEPRSIERPVRSEGPG